MIIIIECLVDFFLACPARKRGLFEFAVTRDIRIVGTSDDASKSLYDIDLRGPVALVLGAEGSGLRQLTARTCDELVRLPMKRAMPSA